MTSQLKKIKALELAVKNTIPKSKIVTDLNKAAEEGDDEKLVEAFIRINRLPIKTKNKIKRLYAQEIKQNNKEKIL